MIYKRVLTIAANTPSTSPARLSQILAPGTIEQVFLTFPDGCAGLVGVRFVVRERVLWPTNPDEWFVNNNFTYDFRGHTELTAPGEIFRFEGYNSDEVYEHSIYFVLEVLPKEPSLLDALLAARPVLADAGE